MQSAGRSADQDPADGSADQDPASRSAAGQEWAGLQPSWQVTQDSEWLLEKKKGWLMFMYFQPVLLVAF